MIWKMMINNLFKILLDKIKANQMKNKEENKNSETTKSTVKNGKQKIDNKSSTTENKPDIKALLEKIKNAKQIKESKQEIESTSQDEDKDE
jgi:hypothetical protein